MRKLPPSYTIELNEPTLREFKQVLNEIPEIYEDCTIRCMSNRRVIIGLELDIGPEWVLWIHTDP